MIYYAAIDTNVLVSAMFKGKSIPDKVIDMVNKGNIIPLMHQEILAEYEDVLNRSRFSFDKQRIAEILDRFKSSGIFLDKEAAEESFIDDSDRVFYEIVLEKRKEDEAYLVTGNMKHFPKRHFVVTPREMLEIMAVPLHQA